MFFPLLSLLDLTSCSVRQGVKSISLAPTLFFFSCFFFFFFFPERRVARDGHAALGRVARVERVELVALQAVHLHAAEAKHVVEAEGGGKNQKRKK